MLNEATFRPDLTDVVMEIATGTSGLIGAQVLPLLPVSTKSGNFLKVAVAQGTKDTGDLKVAPGAAYPRISHVTTEDNYTTEKRGLEEKIPDEHKRDLARYFDDEAATTAAVARHVLVDYEEAVAALAFDAVTNFTAGNGNFADITDEWNDGGNPYNDIALAKWTVAKNCGGVLAPGFEWCMAISAANALALRQNTNVKALLAGGQYSDSRDNMTPDDARLARALGLDQLFVGSATSAAGTEVWNDEYALVFVRRRGNQLAQGIQLGRTFFWTGMTPGMSDDAPFVAETYRDETTESDIVRVKQFTDEKVLSILAGYLIGNVHT